MPSNTPEPTRTFRAEVLDRAGRAADLWVGDWATTTERDATAVVVALISCQHVGACRILGMAPPAVPAAVQGLREFFAGWQLEFGLTDLEVVALIGDSAVARTWHLIRAERKAGTASTASTASTAGTAPRPGHDPGE